MAGFAGSRGSSESRPARQSCSPPSSPDSTLSPSSPAEGDRVARWAKRLVAGIAALLVLAIAAALLLPFGQRVDTGYNPSVAAALRAARPARVCIDEGHYNAHTATGRYRPLARLLEAAGYAVSRHRGAFTGPSLARCDVLVVANAAGGDRFRIGPINLPIHRGGDRGDPAFTPGEVALVRQWVERGGSLLLVADHAPFGQAARPLAAAFGVRMGGGFVEVPRSSPARAGPGSLAFTAESGLLRPHPITAGVRRVMTFTGQSLAGAGEPLLQLPADAVEYVPPGPELRPVSAAGHSQAVALDFGRGRVAVLGEAAMISAQIDDRGEKMGMNVAGTDNEAFALQLFQWLSRAR
jgi:hypothetical protein